MRQPYIYTLYTSPSRGGNSPAERKNMLMPKGFETVNASGANTPVELGGHHLILTEVTEGVSRKGNDMLVTEFDFAANDKQPGYFSRVHADDIRPDKSWPFAGKKYIRVTDEQGNCTQAFKAFINAVQASNPGFKVVWGTGSAFTNQFRGLCVGGVYGEEENEYNGRRSMRRVVRWFCDDSQVENARIPEPKYLKNTNKIVPAPVAVPAPAPAQAQAQTALAGYVAVPDTDAEAIPFF